jgi:hypothetical protein
MAQTMVNISFLTKFHKKGNIVTTIIGETGVAISVIADPS